jgi:hypothetical protein
MQRDANQHYIAEPNLVNCFKFSVFKLILILILILISILILTLNFNFKF